MEWEQLEPAWFGHGQPCVRAGGVNIGYGIAKWNGSSWSPLAGGINNTVRVLAVSGSDLYAGGNFTAAGGSPANYIAKWNGNNWSAVGSGMGHWVSARSEERR